VAVPVGQGRFRVGTVADSRRLSKIRSTQVAEPLRSVSHARASSTIFIRPTARTDTNRAQLDLLDTRIVIRIWLVPENLSLGSSGFVELSTYVRLVVRRIIIQITLCLYFGETYMTNVGSNASPAAAAGDSKQIVFKEIQAKWGR
jgi:hypothetical protein